VDVSWREDGAERHGKVWLVERDPAKLDDNEFLVVNQFTVIEDRRRRRPDVVVFVNGLPLAVIELKNPADEKTTVRHAFNQLQTYKDDIPGLFVFNEALVISDGYVAKAGTLTSGWDRFQPWRTVAGDALAPKGSVQLEVLIKGIFERQRFLDYILNFVTFEDDGKTIAKKAAAYHQYWAVNKAVACTVEACGEMNADRADALPRAAEAAGRYDVREKRIGVVWHTQGAGKSLSMVFYAGKINRHEAMANPTLVVITDRNDLDEQLFGTFSTNRELLRQTPVQARNDGSRRMRTNSIYCLKTHGEAV